MQIEAGAVVDRSILCDGVIVRHGAKVGRGCILSFGVVIDAGVTVPDFTQLTCVPRALVRQWRDAEDGMDKYSDDDEDSDEGHMNAKDFDWSHALATMEPESDTAVVGDAGVGRVWDPSEDNDDMIDSDSDDDITSSKTRAITNARRDLVSRSMGATEYENYVAQRWAVCEEDMPDSNYSVGAEGILLAGLSANSHIGGSKLGEDETLAATDAETDTTMRNLENASPRVQRSEVGVDEVFRNEIVQWVAALRQDDSPDMAMQVKMYALQVDENLDQKQLGLLSQTYLKRIVGIHLLTI